MAIARFHTAAPLPGRTLLLDKLTTLVEAAERIRRADDLFVRNMDKLSTRAQRALRPLREEWARLRSLGEAVLPDGDPKVDALRIRFVEAAL